MEAIIQAITENGIGLVCVAVVIYDHLVNQKKPLRLWKR